MNYYNENNMPLGLGIALAKNTAAANFYKNCNATQKDAILSQARMISSKNEMEAFVSNLPSSAL